VPAETPVPTSILIPDTEAARLCGIGRATWHRLRAAGKVGPQAVRLGRAVRYRRNEVEAWAAAGCPDAPTWAAMRDMENRRSTMRRNANAAGD
jgi:predicted DNA-binding transcriptional regulator AlpA